MAIGFSIRRFRIEMRVELRIQDTFRQPFLQLVKQTVLGEYPERKDRFGYDGQADCSFVSGLWCGAFFPLALMESADPRLISSVGFSPRTLFRLGGSRSDLFAITLCRTLRNLSATTSCVGSCACRSSA